MDPRPPSSLLTRLLSDSPDLEIVSDPSSWKIVRENAARHGVAPLIAFIARRHVNAAERSWCDRILSSSWTHHSRNLQQLDEILAHLEHAGIQALVLKGPVLASRYYQPAFLRKPSIDLDLALRKEDLDRASEALTALGYVPEPAEDGSAVNHHHVRLSHSARPMIELHFRLTHKAFGIPTSEFFERAVPFTIPAGRTVKVLAPADEILHLILHRASGHAGSLFHLYEVHRIWNSAPLEVRREAVETAARHHFAGVFAMTDSALRSRWGQGMSGPGIALKPTWLRWCLDERFSAEFERCSEPGRDPSLTLRMKRKWMEFQMTDSPLDFLRFGAATVRIAWFEWGRRGWRNRAGSTHH